MTTFNPDPDLYEEEEWEMLQSFEQDESRPAHEEEVDLKGYQKLFRTARAEGSYGPVPYDVPYPWSKKNRPAKSPPLAGDAVTGDNPPHTQSETS